MVLLFLIFCLDDKNPLFYLVAQINLTIFAHIIDYETTKILVWNTCD